MTAYRISKAAETLPLERLSELPWAIFLLSWLGFWCMEATDIGDPPGYGLQQCLCSAQTQITTDNNIPSFCDLGSTAGLIFETQLQDIAGVDRTHRLVLVRNEQHNSVWMDQWHIDFACSRFCPPKQVQQSLVQSHFLQALKWHFSLTTCHGSSHGYLVLKGHAGIFNGKVAAKTPCVLGATSMNFRWYMWGFMEAENRDFNEQWWWKDETTNDTGDI